MSDNTSGVSLSEISQQLSVIPFQYSKLSDALKRITELGKEVIGSHTFALALIDTETKAVTEVACTSNNSELEETINNKKQLWNEIASSKQGRVHPVLEDTYHLKVVYSYPLWSAESIIVGYIYHFSSMSEPLTKHQEGLMKSFACRAIVTIENLENYRSLDTKQFLKAFSDLSHAFLESSPDDFKLQNLTKIMLDMLKCNDANDVLKSLLDGALQLASLGNKIISSSDELIFEISRLDYSTGELKIIESNKSQATNSPLKLGKGITGLAIEEMKTIKVDDVLNSEWREKYISSWENTKSEIAIPIFTDKIPVIQGKQVKEIGRKPIGVLNIESPKIKTFSDADAKYLDLLARYAAILIDRRLSDEKVTKIRKKEQQIDSFQNYDQIMTEVIKSITEILEFEVVNISLVDFETQRIKTEYIGGSAIEKNLIEEFKDDADHALSSSDIQASIVRNKQIEVPSSEDPRFDKRVFSKYKHEDLIRVFIPMIELSTDRVIDRVIGTLEAGYNKQYREYIYERDVQILESFVDYVVQALERKKLGLMDRIAHEFRSPIVGIKSNASFIQRRATFIQKSQENLHPALVHNKLEDILTDCDILLMQVAELEYIMGGRVPQRSKREKTRIFTDVILKTIKQLRPIVIEHGFSIENIDYSTVNDRIKLLTITTDKIRLNQVVYNLFMNSIKYAKDDPSQFKIVIGMNYYRDD